MLFEIAEPNSTSLWDEYFDLRWRILRSPWDQPRGSERDLFDEPGSDADHVAVRDERGRLIGVGRLHLNSASEAQIRYMAVEPDHRDQGIGRAIVKRLEELAATRQVDRIVLNARDTVVGFYQRLEYGVVGPGPTMFDVVEHARMEKRLSSAGNPSSEP